MLGMLAGRKQLFIQTESTLLFWKTTLKIAVLVFVPLYIFSIFLPDFETNVYALAKLKIIFMSWSNFAMTLFWIASFVLLYFSSKMKSWLEKLIPFGKMSLSNYIIQSVIGSTLYYKYGFGLYQFTGAMFCFLLVYFCFY